MNENKFNGKIGVNEYKFNGKIGLNENKFNGKKGLNENFRLQFRDQNQYLTEAKRLKHSADVESDTTAQGMMYIEAVMYFVLTGCTMENDRSCFRVLVNFDWFRLIKAGSWKKL